MKSRKVAFWRWAPLVLCLASALSTAEQAPLWELGLGAAALEGPDYRGAEDRSTWLVPMPYVIYRGDFLRADGDSVRGLLHESERLEINLSAGGATPVRSDSSNVREDMPDLDPALEIGPSVNYTLAGSESGPWELEIRFPIRAVITSDFSSVQYQGYVITPTLNFDRRTGIPGGWRLGLSLGPTFGDEENHAYYYDVKPAFARPDRPAYDAQAGYAGTRLSASLSNRFGDVWVGGFARYENLSGAEFEDSPLVEDRHGLSFGVAFAVIFAKSSRMVETE